jgi:thymidylate synthase
MNIDIFYEEDGYLNLLDYTLKNGELKNTRNGKTFSVFGKMIKFNITNNFPLITTKKVFFRGIVEELLWFLKGLTNSKYLEEKGINIWKKNSSREYLDSIGLNDYEEGELGPIYGSQWRNYNNEKFDQLKYVIEELLKPDNSRRAIINAWNPCVLKKQALPPCHLIYNFYKNENGLSCIMFMRSSDLFLGLPFNIASTALLTLIIAKVLHLKTNEIKLSLSDCHIYEEFIDNIKIQTNRKGFNFPTLEIIKNSPDINTSIEEKIKWIEDLKFEDFKLNNYDFLQSLKCDMK